MGTWTRLQAADGFTLSAFVAEPEGEARGGIVLVQEIFGVNSHIQSLATRLAGAGYRVVAPSLFDRSLPEVQLGYGADGVQRGVALMQQASLDLALRDLEAARDAAAAGGRRVAVMGFCWGGLVAWLAACRVPGLAAAVAYYPGGIASFAAEQPGCPVLLHFAEQDDHIPVTDAHQVQALHPARTTVHLYPAHHGFNCDERPSHEPASAAKAWQRSLDFLAGAL